MDLRDQIRKVGDDMGKIARDVADSSKKAAAKAKLRRMIHSSENALSGVYTEIGARYYVENQCQPAPQFAGLFQQAAYLVAQIDVFKAELAELDHASICPACGNTIHDNQKFCPECGAKNAAYGKWQAEAEAADAARRAVKEAQRAEREAREAEQSVQQTAPETTPATAPENAPSVEVIDATACTDGDEA